MPSGGTREYAKWRRARGLPGGPSGVIKAIQTGRITRGADGKIDFEQADREWAANTVAFQGKPLGVVLIAPPAPPPPDQPDLADPHSISRRQHQGSVKPPTAQPPAAPGGDSPERGDTLPAEDVSPDEFPPGETMQESRAKREKYNALLAQLKYEQESGKLLPADEVKRMVFAVGRMHAAARESAPGQLGPKLVGFEDPTAIERVIRDHLRELDLRVSKEIENRYGSLLAPPEIATSNEAA